MNLEQMCQRLEANGRKMKFIDNSAITDNDNFTLEHYDGIIMKNNNWIIYEESYNKLYIKREYTNEHDACISFFLECFRSFYLKIKNNKYLNHQFEIYVNSKEEVINLLKKIKYPEELYTFTKGNNLKNCFYIEGDNNENGRNYYYGRKELIEEIPLNTIFASHFILCYPYILNEEKIQLEQGIIKEPYSDEIIYNCYLMGILKIDMKIFQRVIYYKIK